MFGHLTVSVNLFSNLLGTFFRSNWNLCSPLFPLFLPHTDSLTCLSVFSLVYQMPVVSCCCGKSTVPAPLQIHFRWISPWRRAGISKKENDIPGVSAGIYKTCFAVLTSAGIKIGFLRHSLGNVEASYTTVRVRRGQIWASRIASNLFLVLVHICIVCLVQWLQVSQWVSSTIVSGQFHLFMALLKIKLCNYLVTCSRIVSIVFIALLVENRLTCPSAIVLCGMYPYKCLLSTQDIYKWRL